MNARTRPLTETSDIPVSAPRQVRIKEASRELISVLRPHLESVLSRRHDRPWLALVAVPLAVIAAFLSLQFWAVLPLIVVAWWFASNAWAWTWFLAVVEACFGIQWAMLGAASLASFPRHRLVVGVCWMAYAGIVAAAGLYNRRHASGGFRW